MEHKHGVEIFLDEDTVKHLCGFWCISERVLVVKLRGGPFDSSLIRCYAPTADNNDDEVEKFCEQLDDPVKQRISQDIGIIMGDFNAKGGGERDATAAGPFWQGHE